MNAGRLAGPLLDLAHHQQLPAEKLLQLLIELISRPSAW